MTQVLSVYDENTVNQAFCVRCAKKLDCYILGDLVMYKAQKPTVPKEWRVTSREVKCLIYEKAEKQPRKQKERLKGYLSSVVKQQYEAAEARRYVITLPNGKSLH